MIQLVAFCRSVGAVSPRIAVLALCSAAMVASISPASAKSHHRVRRHVHVHHVSHHTGYHYAHGQHRHYRHLARATRWNPGVEQMRAHRVGRANASLASGSGMTASGGFGSSNIVAEARRYIGGNPTSRGSLWCARFMNMVLQHTGYHGTGSDMARSFASYGHRVSGPQIGAIAVMGRRGGGGHVGIISGIDSRGNPIMVSGNNGNRVREAPVSRGRIYAYVVPTK